MFGNLATCASYQEPPFQVPEKPIRSHSLLHIAVTKGNRDDVQRYMATTPLDTLAGDGLSPLHWALVSREPSALLWLLDGGARVDTRSAEGATPLMNAVQQRSLDQVRLLLGRGADVNAQDHRGFTALHRAADMGLVDITQTLLDQGAEPGIEAAEYTARSLAAKQGHATIVAMLGDSSR